MQMLSSRRPRSQHVSHSLVFCQISWAASTFATIMQLQRSSLLFWGLYAGTLIDRYPRKIYFGDLHG